jgi:hypothetical protein
MPRLNKVFFHLVLPFLVLFWAIGWLIYWIGSQRNSGKPKKLLTPSDLKIFALTPEEEHLLKDMFSVSSKA